MASEEWIASLETTVHVFGPAAARKKTALLAKLMDVERIRSRELVTLQGLLNFLRAYSDNREVRFLTKRLIDRIRDRAVPGSRASAGHLLNHGLPGSSMSYSYHYSVLGRLVRMFPGRLEIDWDSFEDDSVLARAIGTALPTGEADGFEDDRLTLCEWLRLARPSHCQTDLETAISILENSPLSPSLQSQLFDEADTPVVYELRDPGSARLEQEFELGRYYYQKGNVERERFRLEPQIRRPLGRLKRAGRRESRTWIDTALAALCSRNLEIYPLIYGEPRDVTRVSCPRGVEVLFVGTRPEFRAAWEGLYFFLVLKNGVPCAYGPAGVFLGCCEMGINLFPEYRGGETRFFYAQLMRALRHLLGVEHYYCPAYGMGVGNRDAIESGAFWFYRKLGFVAENPRVEALAQAEEERMRENPGYRSDRATLHRLKHTRAVFDLSAGACPPFDFAALGHRVTALVARRWKGDRGVAAANASREVGRALGIKGLPRWNSDERRAFGRVAPALALIPGLASWSVSEKRQLVRAIRSKGAGSEVEATVLFARHPRLGQDLRAVATEIK